MQYEILLDSGETPNKCTIAPLSARSDFHIVKVKGNQPLPRLLAPVLLHHEGKCLSILRTELNPLPDRIACIDCVWSRLDVILAHIEKPLPLFARIPDGFATAYPRRSKKNSDPDGGLATIEALFVAAAMLGTWDPTLFSEYFFGQKFIEINRQRFLDFGINQASDPALQPVLKREPRNAMQRRRDRGRRSRSESL